jgi:hypothetical protein
LGGGESRVGWFCGVGCRGGLRWGDACWGAGARWVLQDAYEEFDEEG